MNVSFLGKVYKVKTEDDIDALYTLLRFLYRDEWVALGWS